MFRTTTGTTAILIMLAILTQPAYAAAPALMNNQGVLRSAAGAPIVDGEYDLAFALYAGQDATEVIWSETVIGVSVQGGLYSTVLGGVVPFPANLFRDQVELWLGVTVGDGAELPRARLLTLAYAFEADHALVATAAESLTCTGCLGEDALGFDLCAATASCTPALQAGAGILVDGGTVSADQDTLAAWAKLACYDNVTELRAALDAVYAPVTHTHEGWEVTSPVAEALSAQDSQALEGKSLGDVQSAVLDAVAGAGYLKQGDPIDHSQLPPNGLDEVSNGTLTNRFSEVVLSSDVPLSIPDYWPPGAEATLEVKENGVLVDIAVAVDVTHASPSDLNVVLVSPNGSSYTLHANGAGQAGGIAGEWPPNLFGSSGKWVGGTGDGPAG